MIATSTRLIVFLGVPHHGSHLLQKNTASLALALGRAVNYSVPPKIKTVLQPEADESYGINTQFMRIKGDTSIINFYEEKSLSLIGNVVVTRDSATFDCETSENMPVARTHQDLVRFEGTNDDFYHTLRQTLNRKVTEIVSAISSAKIYENTNRAREALLSILGEPLLPSVLDQIETPHSHTLQWLWTSDSDFSKWVTHGYGIFAITGKPGSGKSVLMNAVNASIRKYLGGTFSVVVSHFFNSRGNPTEKTITGFLRSILVQLLRIDVRFFHGLEHDWEVLSKQTLYDDAGSSSAQNFPQRYLTAQFLEEMVLNAIKGMPAENKILILVDGLDECEDGLSDLNSIANILNSIADSQEGRSVRICFSCRSLEPYNFNQISGSFNLHEHNGPDIVRFVDDHWESMPSMSNYNNEITTLKSWVVSRADGIFLWVRLVLERIQKALATGATVSEIKTIIDTPNQLHGLFSMLIDRIETEFLDESRTMFSIILAAKRPLSLREFRVVLALKDSYFESQEELYRSPTFIQNDGIMKRRIQSRCGGLVEIKTTGDLSQAGEDWLENNTVQFIHQSVKDFLIQPNERSIIIPDLDTLVRYGHIVLGSACTNYLCQKDIWNLARRPDWIYDHRKVFSRHSKFFLAYAEENWITHLQGVETLGAADLNTANLLISNPDNFETWKLLHSQFHPTDKVSQDYDAIQLAVEHNLQHSLRWLCNNGLVDVNMWNWKFGSYLHIAVTRNNVDVARVLLENGARVNAKVNVNTTNWTPLVAACCFGHLESATLLLEFGAEIKDSILVTDDPLIAAIRSGNEALVERILEYAGGIYAHPWHRDRVLSNLRFWESSQFIHYGSKQNGNAQSQHAKWHGIFRMICQHLNFDSQVGLQINPSPVTSRNIEINTAYLRPELDKMCWVGSTDSVRTLLESLRVGKALPEWIHGPSSFKQSTLVHWAALNPCYPVLSYLLELGLSPDSQDINGETPLHLATREQKEEHIRVLLDYNADRKIKSVKGFRAFHQAIQVMSPDASTWLLDKLTTDVCDVNVQVIDGVYPLQLAAVAGAFTALKWLLDKGADINVRDDHGRTVLHSAASSCSLASMDILRYLINQKHDAEVRDSVGRTPLHMVLYSCETKRNMNGSNIALENVKCLVRNGADVNAQDHEGNTPLHLAAWKSHRGIVNLLLRAGAQTSKADNRGLTALDMARDDEIRESIEMSDLNF
ncbi:ankyrin repeat-containing domain protein [Annulohypoxylon maeteangense]|uniref:ankyrin repeat-containing domain protein n=1 Tax=Annulohypoxylon maeteangense TaxID=1927788 RepID=UPI0020071E80|nr:ankyrin repeat-containing domain protein [Annulohypoxylon maeteangense]KAI0882899.1 ankyrin repeat-containing domain protein [Annulohypoxylon maeteangense]